MDDSGCIYQMERSLRSYPIGKTLLSSYNDDIADTNLLLVAAPIDDADQLSNNQG